MFAVGDQWQEPKMDGRNRVISGEKPYIPSQNAQNHAFWQTGKRWKRATRTVLARRLAYSEASRSEGMIWGWVRSAARQLAEENKQG